MEDAVAAALEKQIAATNTSAPQLGHIDREELHGEVCTICLSAISERAVASPCNHLTFDFLCLVQWSQNSAACPLCKSEIEEIHYDFRETTDFKRYIVPRAAAERRTSTATSETTIVRRQNAEIERQCLPRVQDSMLEARKRIYQKQNFSLHVGNNGVSKYVSFTARDFAASVDLQNKARSFLRRELRVFDEVLASRHDSSRRTRGLAATVEYLVEYITAILRVHDIKAHDGRAEDLVAEFVGPANARLLMHEIDSWLRSPYRNLHEWDENVLYPNAV